jgi:chorismate synthase
MFLLGSACPPARLPACPPARLPACLTPAAPGAIDTRMLRFTTAGESHGPALVTILEGIPAGLALLAEHVNTELVRRQGGYGRGRRMQIEQDSVEFLAGVRAGETLGSPIAMLIRNRDWTNWQDIMDPAPRESDPGLRRRAVTRPRPGHADLTGVLKYDRDDARDILERASARETTARVAAGAICRHLLREFGIRIGSHVVHLGGIDAATVESVPDELNATADVSPLRTLDRDAEQRMIERIDTIKREGNTLGGICEVICDGLPVGLGSHVSWDRKLDGRLAAAIMSIPAVKGVEIGMGFEAARRTGAEVHDEIELAPGRPSAGNVRRRTNRAGGLEGGMTTGEPLVVRVAMKPISTLMRPLRTVDFAAHQPAAAVAERSDVTAVPAMGVIAEAMMAFIVAQAFLEKFGGDSLGETRRNFNGYIAHISGRLGVPLD